MSDLGVLHGVEKISTKATTLLQTSLRSEVRARRYDLPKSRDSNRDDFGTISGFQLGSPGNLCHLDVASAASCREYYKGEGGGFPRVRAVVSLVCPNARGKSQHHQRVSRMLN
jgi:hypothetical protein